MDRILTVVLSVAILLGVAFTWHAASAADKQIQLNTRISCRQVRDLQTLKEQVAFLNHRSPPKFVPMTGACIDALH